MNRSRITVMNVTPSNTKNGPQPHLLSRRNFLELAGKGLLTASGLLGLGGMLRFLGYQSETAIPNAINLGSATNYPPGSRTFISEAQAFILHTPDGFTALSAICPHLGCSVNPGSDGFDCPCHGSRFDANGRNQQGPANQSLRNLTVEKRPDGQLTLLI